MIIQQPHSFSSWYILISQLTSTAAIIHESQLHAFISWSVIDSRWNTIVNSNQVHSMIEMFSLRVWFCLRGNPIRLRLLVQVDLIFPLISLKMVRSGSGSDGSFTPIRHLRSYCFILAKVFSLRRSISFTPCCSLPSFIRNKCIFQIYRQLHTPFRISSIFHFQLLSDCVFMCLLGVIRLVPLLWMLNRLRVGDILFQALGGQRMMDLESTLLFSAGTLMTPPGLAMSRMYENSYPRWTVFLSRMVLSSRFIF